MRLIYDSKDSVGLVDILGASLGNVRIWGGRTFDAMFDQRLAKTSFIGPPWPILRLLNRAYLWISIMQWLR